jgi:hypothetical protein
MSLTFKHSIPIECLSGDNETQLTISINDQQMVSRNFPKHKTEQINIEFSNTYEEGHKNKITFEWHGESEHEKKFIKIKSISIHDQILNINNAEYFPELNPEWWDSLTAEQQNQYNQIIYGKTGGVFGWYGQVNFYFCTGLDFRARHVYNKSNNDSRRLLNQQIGWIYKNKSSARSYHRIKE